MGQSRHKIQEDPQQIVITIREITLQVPGVV